MTPRRREEHEGARRLLLEKLFVYLRVLRVFVAIV